jgi:uncharacterized protein DUF7025
MPSPTALRQTELFDRMVPSMTNVEYSKPDISSPTASKESTLSSSLVNSNADLVEQASTDVTGNGADSQALRELVRDVLRQERLELQSQVKQNKNVDGLTSQYLASYISELEKKVTELEKKDKNKEGIKNEERKGSIVESDTTQLVVKRLKKATTKDAAVPDVIDNADGVEAGDGSKNQKYILTVIRNIEDNQNKLDIRSQQIITVLRQLVDYYPSQALAGSKISLVEPYMLLFHFHKQLAEKAKSDDQDTETKLHLEHLLEFMKKDCPEVSQELDALENDGGKGIISFPNAWLLFAPGTIVYSTQESAEKDESEKTKVVISSQEGEKRAYVVEELSGCDIEKLPSGREIRTALKLRCWSIDYDGHKFGRTYSELYIRPFNGSRDITELEIVPEKYADPLLRHKLIERGRTFWDLKEKRYNFRSYTGKAWSKTSANVSGILRRHGFS